MTNPGPPSPTRHRLFRVVLWSAVVVAVYAAVAGLGLPWLLRPRLEAELSGALGRKTRLDALSINPFVLSVSARGLEAYEPDGSALLRCKKVYADFQLASLWHRGLVLRTLTLVKPYVHLAMNADRELNLAGLPLFAKSRKKKPLHLPPLAVEKLEIDGGALLFTDHSRPTPFREEIAPIHVQLERFSTLADHSAPYALRATTADGDAFEWEGMLAFRPLRSEGRFHAVGTLPETAWRYLQDMLHFDVGNASLEVSTHYAIQDLDGKLSVSADGGEMRLRNLSLKDRTTRRTVLTIPSVDVEGVGFDLASRRISIASLASRGGSIGIRREKSGALDLPHLLAPRKKQENAAPTATPKATADRGGRIGLELRLKKLAIDDYTVDFEDLTTSPPARLQAKHVSLRGSGLSSAPREEENLALRLDLEGGGRLKLDGTVTPKPVGARLAVSADGLELRPLQPYLSQVAKLRIDGGKLALDGRLALLSPTPAGTAPATAAEKESRWRYQGRVAVDDLRVSESGQERELAGWRSLRLDGVSLTGSPGSLSVADVLWQKPVLHLRRAADGRIDTSWWLGPSAASTQASGDASPSGPSWSLEIAKLKVEDGGGSMTDASVEPPVRSVLDGLGVTLSGFSMPGRDPAALALTGQLNDEAPVSIQGELGAPLSQAPTRLEVKIANYGMTSLSPYAARYIGETIDRGKLSIDGTLRLSGTELRSSNRLVMDQLALGHEVESREAGSVPIGLAMALLRDGEGRITLDVPVEGDISSPGFSYRAQFGRALVNVIRKVASSPFAVVGSLVGGGSELGFVEFAPGSDILEPDQAQKVDALAKALQARPDLILEVRGTASSELDGTGNKAALLKLAQQRAAAIRDHLVSSKGIAAERVFLLAPVERPPAAGARRVRVELSLTAR